MHSRRTFRFTPTSSSRLNAVEVLFAKPLLLRRLGHSFFRSVGELRQAILHFIEERNATEARPFSRTADPGKIIAAGKEGFSLGIKPLGKPSDLEIYPHAFNARQLGEKRNGMGSALQLGRLLTHRSGITSNCTLGQLFS